jgi:2'-hydroxyisoflavone reductase
MKLLLLGGTQFLGYHVVRLALERGHEVTLFNRGVTNPGAFPEAEHLVGDRDHDLSALEGRSWDAVIDTTAFVPVNVRRTCELLRDAVEHYTFVSSVRRYDPYNAASPMAEDAPAVEGGSEEELEFPRDQIPLTPLCEREFDRCFGDRLLTPRPGFIVGPLDQTDRFTYWPRRVAEGGDVLVAGPPARELQTIDVRDVADWILTATERRLRGPYNLTGPARQFDEILELCKQITGGESARFVWVDGEWLLEQGVKPHLEMTCWFPEPEFRRMRDVDTTKAHATGFLHLRPLEETIRDTFEWDAARPRPLPRGRTGTKYFVETMLPEREAELLALWQQRAVTA